MVSQSVTWILQHGETSGYVLNFHAFTSCVLFKIGKILCKITIFSRRVVNELMGRGTRSVKTDTLLENQEEHMDVDFIGMKSKSKTSKFDDIPLL